MHATASPRPPFHACAIATLLMALAPLPCAADQALAQKAGCTACHSTSAKVLGPSFREVAGKYAGDSQAAAALRDSIRAGGSGKWGAIPMPPQPALPKNTLDKLAAWIAAGAP